MSRVAFSALNLTPEYADADLFATVDVSDTSSAATGTTKKGTLGGLRAAFEVYFDLQYDALGASATAESNANSYTDTEISGLSAVYQPLDTQLTDLAALAYGSNALKIVAVNATADGWTLLAQGAAGGIDADLLDGQHGAHYLARANHTGTQTLATISDAGTAAAANVGTSGDVVVKANTANTWSAAQTIDGVLRVNNYVAFGNAPASNVGLYLRRNITGSTTAYGTLLGTTVASDVTGAAFGFYSNIGTEAASFTLGSLIHFRATQTALGSGSAVTNQTGFYIDSTLVDATNNYGFRGDIAAASGRWNVFMLGTAQNYFAGNVGIGSGKNVPAQALDVAGNGAFTGTVTATGHVKPGSFTVATLPTATAGGIIYVTNETGGAVIAFADGTNWRRCTDRAIVS